MCGSGYPVCSWQSIVVIEETCLATPLADLLAAIVPTVPIIATTFQPDNNNNNNSNNNNNGNVSSGAGVARIGNIEHAIQFAMRILASGGAVGDIALTGMLETEAACTEQEFLRTSVKFQQSYEREESPSRNTRHAELIRNSKY